MATSSIFANFNITDTETAEAFVAALDASSHDPKREPVASVKPPLTDHTVIRAFLAKRKQDVSITYKSKKTLHNNQF